jgi:hypothetical protein
MAIITPMHAPFVGVFTSAYDLTRWIWLNGRRVFSPHAGIDISSGRVGSPFYAAFGGTVRKAVSWAKAGNKVSTWAPGRTGNGVLISSPDQEGYGYNHMRPIVSAGQSVKIGQVIGYGDTSGQQTGPHCHFESWVNWKDPNSHYNPKVLFDVRGVRVGQDFYYTGSNTGKDDLMTDAQFKAIMTELAAIRRDVSNTYQGTFFGSTANGQTYDGVVEYLKRIDGHTSGVIRPGDPRANVETGLVSMLQEIADAKTYSMANNAAIADLAASMTRVQGINAEQAAGAVSKAMAASDVEVDTNAAPRALAAVLAAKELPDVTHGEEV